MSDHTYSELLRELSKNYYQNHIGFTEYRAKRKEVLDLIDAEFNGQHVQVLAESAGQQESSFISKAIGLFKSNGDQ